MSVIHNCMAFYRQNNWTDKWMMSKLIVKPKKAKNNILSGLSFEKRKISEKDIITEKQKA